MHWQNKNVDIKGWSEAATMYKTQLSEAVGVYQSELNPPDCQVVLVIKWWSDVDIL